MEEMKIEEDREDREDREEEEEEDEKMEEKRLPSSRRRG